MKRCTECPNEFTYKGTKCYSCRVNARRYALKQRCVEYKGGKCETCGYDACVASLSFHHRDPTTKLFTLSGAHSRSWFAIQLELDKCDILCLNCHSELEFKQHQQRRANRQIPNIA